jgi:hypothetical protein
METRWVVAELGRLTARLPAESFHVAVVYRYRSADHDSTHVCTYSTCDVSPNRLAQGLSSHSCPLHCTTHCCPAPCQCTQCCFRDSHGHMLSAPVLPCSRSVTITACLACMCRLWCHHASTRLNCHPTGPHERSTSLFVLSLLPPGLETQTLIPALAHDQVVGLGLLGKEGSGRLRIVATQSKLKISAKNAKKQARSGVRAPGGTRRLGHRLRIGWRRTC